MLTLSLAQIGSSITVQISKAMSTKFLQDHRDLIMRSIEKETAFNDKNVDLLRKVVKVMNCGYTDSKFVLLQWDTKIEDIIGNFFNICMLIVTLIDLNVLVPYYIKV